MTAENESISQCQSRLSRHAPALCPLSSCGTWLDLLDCRHTVMARGSPGCEEAGGGNSSSSSSGSGSGPRSSISTLVTGGDVAGPETETVRETFVIWSKGRARSETKVRQLNHPERNFFTYRRRCPPSPVTLSLHWYLKWQLSLLLSTWLWGASAALAVSTPRLRRPR